MMVDESFRCNECGDAAKWMKMKVFGPDVNICNADNETILTNNPCISETSRLLSKENLEHSLKWLIA
jgi:hypothetical protein